MHSKALTDGLRGPWGGITVATGNPLQGSVCVCVVCVCVCVCARVHSKAVSV